MKIEEDAWRWRKREPTYTSQTFSGSNFTKPQEELTAIQYFKKFFSDDLIQYIAK